MTDCNGDNKAKRGHVYRYTETGNRCQLCNGLSANQEQLAQHVRKG